MRSLILRILALGSAITTLSLGLIKSASAMPAILLTQDVGSQVNVRSQPTTQSSIVHQGITGDRLNTLSETSGNDGFTWYNVQFEASGLRGWVREDLLQLGTHEAPIRSGKYWVGPVGMGLEVDDDQYLYFDETGGDEWRSIDDLQYVMDGVVLYGGDYWCHADLPTPEPLSGQPSTITQCAADGWNWLSF